MKKFIFFAVIMVSFLSRQNSVQINQTVLLHSSAEMVSSYSVAAADHSMPDVFISNGGSLEYSELKELDGGVKFLNSFEIFSSNNSITFLQNLHLDDSKIGQVLGINGEIFFLQLNTSELSAWDYQDMFPLNQFPIFGDPIFSLNAKSIQIVYLTIDPLSETFFIRMVSSDDSGITWSNPTAVYHTDKTIQLVNCLSSEQETAVTFFEEDDRGITVGYLNLEDGSTIWGKPMSQVRAVVPVNNAGGVPLIAVNSNAQLEISKIQIEQGSGLSLFPIAVMQNIQNPEEIIIQKIGEDHYALLYTTPIAPSISENDLFFVECKAQNCSEPQKLNIEYSYHSGIKINSTANHSIGFSWLETIRNSNDTTYKIWYLPFDYVLTESISLVETPQTSPISTEELDEIITSHTQTPPPAFDPERPVGLFSNPESELDEYLVLGAAAVPVLIILGIILWIRGTKK